MSSKTLRYIEDLVHEYLEEEGANVNLLLDTLKTSCKDAFLYHERCVRNYSSFLDGANSITDTLPRITFPSAQPESFDYYNGAFGSESVVYFDYQKSDGGQDTIVFS